MYKICHLLLVLGACTGNRKQSTPQPLSSKPLTFHTAYTISCQAPGIGAKNPHPGSTSFLLFLSYVCHRTFPQERQPQNLCRQVAMNLRNQMQIWQIMSEKIYILRSLGVYIENILSHASIYSMYRNYLAAINVHLFIYLFFDGLNILINTFCVCADGFLFTALYNYELFFASSKILILKMLTETLRRIPFSVIGRCSLVPTCHWLQGKCARINLSLQASFRIICTYYTE